MTCPPCHEQSTAESRVPRSGAAVVYAITAPHVRHCGTKLCVGASTNNVDAELTNFKRNIRQVPLRAPRTFVSPTRSARIGPLACLTAFKSGLGRSYIVGGDGERSAPPHAIQHLPAGRSASVVRLPSRSAFEQSGRACLGQQMADIGENFAFAVVRRPLHRALDGFLQLALDAAGRRSHLPEPKILTRQLGDRAAAHQLHPAFDLQPHQAQRPLHARLTGGR